MIDATPDLMILLDRGGFIIFANATALDRAGLGTEIPFPPLHWENFIPPTVHHAVRRGLEKSFAGKPNRFRVKEPVPGRQGVWWNASLTPLPDEHGKCQHVLLVARDFTGEKRQTNRMRWTANHDGLTGLGNRGAFTACLGRLIRRAGTKKSAFALLLVDVDHLHLTNEAFGNEAGDALLIALGRRLRGNVRTDNMIARIGDDEFGIILDDLTDPAEVLASLNRIASNAGQPLLYKHQIIDFQLSVGAAIFPEHGEELEHLIRSAEVAVNDAKTAGGARIVLFEPKMRLHVCERAAMISTANTILRENRLVPFYQPKLNLASGRTVGFEALFRYHDTELGIQGPSSIAAALGNSVTASQIGECMQGKVLSDVQEWLRVGIEFGHVAINVADAELREEGFAQRLLTMLDDYGIPPNRLKLEITETVLLDEKPHHVASNIVSLNEAGVCLSLDDFGTGYASLIHLKQFPVSEIKIDVSFVRDLPDPDAAVIIRAMLNLGRSLKIDVVAEGVENALQAKFLRDEGCDFAQGYLFGQAAPASNVLERLAAPSSSANPRMS